jgi:hypothetical protein
VLALKAVLLNLVSLAAAFGIVVLVFQQGHGSADCPVLCMNEWRTLELVRVRGRRMAFGLVRPARGR